jgi:hypothetical protein
MLTVALFWLQLGRAAVWGCAGPLAGVAAAWPSSSSSSSSICYLLAREDFRDMGIPRGPMVMIRGPLVLLFP